MVAFLLAIPIGLPLILICWLLFPSTRPGWDTHDAQSGRSSAR